MFLNFFSAAQGNNTKPNRNEYLSAVEYLFQALAKPKKRELEKVKRKFDVVSQVLSMEDVLATENVIVGAGLEVFIEKDLLMNWCLLTSIVNREYSDDERLLVREYRKCLINTAAFLVGTMGTPFLFNTSVHSALNLLLKEESSVKISDCFLEFVQLEYQLCLRILESQELLDLFSTKASVCDGKPPKSQQNTLPIFDHLLQLVYLEGDEGEYARAAFEALTKQASPETPTLEAYLLSAEVASVLLAYLTGIFAQLPDILYGISTNKKEILKKDLKRFEESYLFVQNCLKTPSKLMKEEILKQVNDFLLAQVILCSLIASNDLDGSSQTLLFYIQFMIDITDDQDLLEVIASFLFSMPSINDQDTQELPLCSRDIIFSKLNSLSEPVVASVLLLISSLFSKGTPTFLLPLFFTNFAEDSHLSHSTYHQSSSQIMVSDYQTLLPKEATINTTSFEEYVTNAIASLSLNTLDADIQDSSLPDGEAHEMPNHSDLTNRIEKFKQDWFFQTLFSKLDSFFSQSLQINVTLANIFSLLATKLYDDALIVALFERSSLNGPCLYDKFLTLNSQVDAYKETVGSYDIRILIARHKLLTDVKGGTLFDLQLSDTDEEGEMINDIVILEEFIKVMVSIVVAKWGDHPSN